MRLIERFQVFAILLLGLLWAPVHASEPWSARVTVTTTEAFAHLQESLQVIGQSGVNQLRDFILDSDTNTNIGSALDAQLAQAQSDGIERLLVLNLEDEKKDRAVLTVQIFNAQTGVSVYRSNREYRFKSEQSLLAQIEYQLPNQLKTDFKQMGRVVDVDSNVVFFDIGSGSDVNAGQIYRVFRQGKEITGESGESFGFLDDQTGVIKVKTTSSVYSTAEILLGRISIEKGDWVELVDGNSDDYHGVILSKLDDQVAINLGKNVGVSEGAYFAVYKDVKSINDQDAFREMIGRIRVTEVFDEYAKGHIASSNHFSLAKAMINDGDYIEEVEGSGGIQYSFGQFSANILTDASNIYVVGAEKESLSDTALRYRARLGYGSALMASVGMSSGLKKSDTLHYGIDITYLQGLGANLFMKVDVPTPLDRYGTLSMETGYLVGVGDDYAGLNMVIGLRLNL